VVSQSRGAMMRWVMGLNSMNWRKNGMVGTKTTGAVYIRKGRAIPMARLMSE